MTALLTGLSEKGLNLRIEAQYRSYAKQKRLRRTSNCLGYFFGAGRRGCSRGDRTINNYKR